MKDKQQRQHGLWPSPVTPKSLAGGKRFGEVQWDDGGETLVWTEGRGDKGVLVAAGGGGREAPRDLTSDGSVRARVGYGGGDFTVARGRVYYADAESGRLCHLTLAGGAPEPLTPPFGSAASPRVSPDGRFVAYVHHDGERIDRLAVVDAAGKLWPQILASGHDFYTQPRWSPDGRRFAFVAWDHPQMPWDGSTLYLGNVVPALGGLPVLEGVKAVAGAADVSVMQPEFTGDGKSLVYVSDESGFWQLHALDLASAKTRQLTATEGAEYGIPNWGQEIRTYALTADGRHAIACVNKRGFIRISRVELATGEAEPIDALAAYTDAGQPVIAGGRLAFTGSSATISGRVVVHQLGSHDAPVAARATGETLAEGDLSQPVALTWRSGGAEEAHGLFYAPASSRYTAGGRPPLVVLVHGGPTSQVRAGYQGQAQFFTSRGYAVLFVNHRGSTGYGRDYMLKLRGRWGVVDVEDSVSGVRHLADAGKIDPERTVIMGGSAGGYTVLQTMVDEPEAFTAGIVLYGVANQFTLVADTHKFEERYSDSLLGPLPEAAKIYRQRSPLFHAGKIKRPLAIFQGSKDKVVPKDQSDQIVAALRKNGTPHVYHVYEGEGHGFRKAETLEHFYGAVDAFLREHVIYR